ncbi:MAG: 6-carboxytetrahydropterin synthase [Cyanobium sp.]
MHEAIKHFDGFPCCHRQWRHDGHCRFVHGYSRSFTFWFRSHSLDENQFVVDFSSLKSLRKKLEEQFDHTFLVNKDDPLLDHWQNLHALGALNLRVMTNVGMESTAEMIWTWANDLVLAKHGGRVCCYKTESRENTKNAATYSDIPSWFHAKTTHVADSIRLKSSCLPATCDEGN